MISAIETLWSVKDISVVIGMYGLAETVEAVKRVVDVEAAEVEARVGPLEGRFPQVDFGLVEVEV